MHFNTKELKILIWVDETAWNEEQSSQILKSFEPLSTQKDASTAIGAGASGLRPELEVLIQFAHDHYQQFLVEGFIKAVGTEVLKLLISGLKHIARIKPNPNIPTNEGLGYEVNSADLNLHIQAGENMMLVTIPLVNEKDYDEAFDALPKAIDKAYKAKTKFSRMYWTSKSWKRI